MRGEDGMSKLVGDLAVSVSRRQDAKKHKWAGMSSLTIREFRPQDVEAVDALVRESWLDLAPLMPGWHELAPRLNALTQKADDSEVLVAERGGRLLGAVGYVGARQAKPDFFPADWPIVRLLSVAPIGRGRGVGQRLLDECIARARRDGAPTLALHTSPVMKAAQSLYAKSGFVVHRTLPDMYGVPYLLLVKKLG